MSEDLSGKQKNLSGEMSPVFESSKHEFTEVNFFLHLSTKTWRPLGRVDAKLQSFITSEVVGQFHTPADLLLYVLVSRASLDMAVKRQILPEMELWLSRQTY
jgi:hypothetical protein